MMMPSLRFREYIEARSRSLTCLMPRLLNSRRQARRSRQVAIEITLAGFPAGNASRMLPLRPRGLQHSGVSVLRSVSFAPKADK
jgi:hypothetical protein